jgi:hypothetical protein
MNIVTTLSSTRNGSMVEVKSAEGYPPMVILNGVVQDPADYSISGNSVFFHHGPSEAWAKWFAWRPVQVKGRWTWLKPVYRRRTNGYVNHDDWADYEYGTIFDVLNG